MMISKRTELLSIDEWVHETMAPDQVKSFVSFYKFITSTILWKSNTFPNKPKKLGRKTHRFSNW